MNDKEAQIHSLVWRLIIGLAGVAIVTAGGCTAYESKLVADAIAAGVPPIHARCAINGWTNSNSSAVLCVQALR